MSTGLLGFGSIEQRGGKADAYISASRLNCWLKCPLAFRLRYIDGIRTPPSPSLFLGKVLHAGLEAVYRHRQLGITLEADQVVQKMLDGWAKLIDEETVTFRFRSGREASPEASLRSGNGISGLCPERREAAGRRGCSGSSVGRS